MILTLENGSKFEVLDWMEITCPRHGVKKKFGELSAMGQLAVESGLDSDDTLPCLLLDDSDYQPTRYYDAQGKVVETL